MAECECGAEIMWAYTTNGKRMPLSVASKERRFVFDAALTESDAMPIYRFVDTYISHFADCPKAEQFRKRG